MDINDLYYDKYIKYKTKYLELKEQSGNGLIKKIFNSLKKYKSKKNVIEPKTAKELKELKEKQEQQQNELYGQEATLIKEKKEKQLYGEEALTLINDFFKPLDIIKFGDNNSSKRKSSKDDILDMYKELIVILNKIKVFNKNIENLQIIINIIVKSYKDFRNNKIIKYPNQYNNYKNIIHIILNSEKNKKISTFNSLKEVINTYLYLMIQSNLGVYDYYSKQPA